MKLEHIFFLLQGYCLIKIKEGAILVTCLSRLERDLSNDI